jgi:hypothetical protein
MRLFKVFPITPSAAAPDLDSRRFAVLLSLLSYRCGGVIFWHQFEHIAAGNVATCSSMLQPDMLPPVQKKYNAYYGKSTDVK